MSLWTGRGGGKRTRNSRSALATQWVGTQPCFLKIKINESQKQLSLMHSFSGTTLEIMVCWNKAMSQERWGNGIRDERGKNSQKLSKGKSRKLDSWPRNQPIPNMGSEGPRWMSDPENTHQMGCQLWDWGAGGCRAKALRFLGHGRELRCYRQTNAQKRDNRWLQKKNLLSVRINVWLEWITWLDSKQYLCNHYFRKTQDKKTGHQRQEASGHQTEASPGWCYIKCDLLVIWGLKWVWTATKQEDSHIPRQEEGGLPLSKAESTRTN